MRALRYRLLLFALSVCGCYLPLMLHTNDDIFIESDLQRALSLDNLSVHEFLLMIGTFSGCISIAAIRFWNIIINLNEMNVIVEFYERLLIIITTMMMGCLVVSSSEVTPYYCRLFVCCMAASRICWSTALFSLLRFYIGADFDDATSFLLNAWFTVPEILSCFVSGIDNAAGVAIMMMRFSGLAVLMFSLFRWTYRKLGAYALLELSYLVFELVYVDEEIMALAYLTSFIAAFTSQLCSFYAHPHPHGWADINCRDLAFYAGSLVFCNVLVMVCSSRIIRHYTVDLQRTVKEKREYEQYLVQKLRQPLGVVETGIQVLAEESQFQVQQSQFHQQPVLGGADGKMTAEIGACDEVSRLVDIFVDNCHGVDAFSTENELVDIVDLGTFVEASLFPFATAAKAKHITFSTVNGCADCKGKFVKMDANKLNQVMRDVLTNALQYTMEGGFISVTATVHTRLTQGCGLTTEQEFVTIRVKDSGIGIVKKYLPMIMDERIRIRNNKLVEFSADEPNDGTAMSLSVARQVLESHSGWLTVESGGIGQGTSVFLTLPTVPDDHPGDVSEAHLSTTDRYAVAKSSAYYAELTSPSGPTPVPNKQGKVLTLEVPERGKGKEVDNRETMAPAPSPASKPPPASAGTLNAPWRPSRLERIVSAVELYPAEAGDAKAQEDSRGHKRRFGDSLHVLIVDDSAMNCKILGRLVKLLGHTHDTAEDGQFCLDKVQAAAKANSLDRTVRKFDAILIENSLPRLGGAETVQMLRNVLDFRGIIIGVAGNSVPSSISNFIEQGAQQILLKPVSVDQLKGALKSCTALCEEKYGEFCTENEELNSFTSKPIIN